MKSKPAYILFIFIIISLVLGVVDKNNSSYKSIHTSIFWALTPVYMSVSLISESTSSIGFFFKDRADIAQQLQQTKKENIELNLKISQLKSMQKDYSQLSSLYDLKKRDKIDLQVAQVVGTSLNTGKLRMYINKGKNHNIKIGDIIFDHDGIIGQVEFVNLLTSVVLLITDVLHYTPVLDKKNNQRFIAHGSGVADILTIKTIAYDNKIQVGDKLITSGLGGRFFRHYPVGVVTAINKNKQGDELNITIKTSASLTTKEFVAIYPAIRNFPEFSSMQSIK